MKKVLKNLFILTMVATMAFMPSGTTLAASNSEPTLAVQTDTLRYYDFRPNNYILAPNYSMMFTDIFTDDGSWEVPANTTFTISYQQRNNSSFSIIVRKVLSPNKAETVIYTAGGGIAGTIQLPISDKDEHYKIYILAIDTCEFYGYTGTWS